MFARLSAIALAAAFVSTASLAHAEDVPKKSCNKTTGIVLTTVGGSLILTAPLVVAIGAAASSASPYSYAAIGPVVLGAFGGAVIGLGMLIPGIVMIATSKPTKVQPASPRIEAKQPTWTELRPVGMNAPRVVGFPIFRGSWAPRSSQRGPRLAPSERTRRARSRSRWYVRPSDRAATLEREKGFVPEIEAQPRPRRRREPSTL